MRMLSRLSLIPALLDFCSICIYSVTEPHQDSLASGQYSCSKHATVHVSFYTLQTQKYTPDRFK